jgi:hypothetical protein
MPTGSGTSLVCVATDDGVFLAADDLVYVERDGEALPLSTNFRKVCGTERILIGTAGLMVHTDIKYDVQVWVRDFINTHAASLSEFPSSVAQGIFEKLKETFGPAESLVAQDVWKGYLPGDRLVNYVVAGYTKNFKRPYIFEVGVEINRKSDGFAYISPIHHHKALPHNVRFGEDHFMERADAGIEPEHSLVGQFCRRCPSRRCERFPERHTRFSRKRRLYGWLHQGRSAFQSTKGRLGSACCTHRPA